MRLRGALTATATATVVASVLVAAPAQAATGTTVTPRVVTGAGLGFDTCQAPSTAVLRAWSASPYNSVNIYFSGSQRLCPNQPLLTPDWVTTVLANGWSLIPTVVDLQAPCAGNSQKAKMSSDPNTSWQQGIGAATTAHGDLATLGLAGAAAYLDLEKFVIPPGNTTCGPAVESFVHAFTKRLHALGDKAGVYFNAHGGATTIAPMYGHALAPDDVWVANWDGLAASGDASIASKWPHHRIHQYYSDGPSGHPDETYGGETINVDRDAIDGDVVRGTSLTTPSGPPYTYNVIGTPNGTLNERSAPSTSAAASPTPAKEGDSLDIQCQATGEQVDGDYVWDKLTNSLYVSDLYTSTTGRNWVSSAIAKCDTTPPTLSVSPLPSVTVGPAATIAWSAADSPDPDGNPNAEARGISGTTVRFRTASWRSGFGAWRTYTTTTASSVRLTLSLGYTYCVQVQTRDLSGNPSAWSASTCTTRPLDDRALAASSGWTRKTSSHYYKLTFTKATTKGRVLSFTKARARHLAVVAATCTTCGAVRVYIGSRYVGTVNLRASATRYRQLFDLKPFAITSGTVKLVTTSNRLVQIDGLVISRV